MNRSRAAYDNYVMDSSYAVIPRHTSTEGKGENDVQVGTRKNGMLEKVFKDKLTTIRITLFDIVHEINDRSLLDEVQAKKIDEEICRLRTKLFELESYPIGSNQIADRRRGALEDKIHELERSLWNQDIKRWQDVVILKKELRQTFREYQDLKRKFMIIDGKS